MSGPLHLGPLALGGAAALLLLNGLASVWLGLGLERRLVIASLRATVQLALLALVLEPVFSWGHPGVVLALGLGMVALAGREGTRRVSRRYRGMVPAAVLSMGLAAGTTTVLASAVLIGVEPWYAPQYFIPLLGMILGNSLTGVALGLDRCLSGLADRQGEVEGLLAVGATPWEAARPIAADAVRSGMVPILNSMSAVGLVTIPGMMTGQILGGTPPGEAARYQLLILFLIAAAVALGTTTSVLLAHRALFDDQARLRLDRLTDDGARR